MKNRVLELCLSNGIETVKDFAKQVNIPITQAAALINKDDSVIIDSETIAKCLKYFNVSYEYLMALVE